MEETSFGLHLLYSSWRDQVLISSPDPEEGQQVRRAKESG